MKKSNIALAVVAVVLLIAAGWMTAARLGVVRSPVKASKLIPTNHGNRKHHNAYVVGDDAAIKVDTLGPRKWKTIDIHEHLQGEPEAKMLLAAMDKFGIQRTCLMGSTKYTLTLSPLYGFEGFKENNEALLAVKKKWPDRFCVFVTMNPLDEGNLQLLQDYVKRGADGLKLYIGHGGSTGKGPFHSMRIDDPRMDPIFAWAEETQLPIVLHVNLTKFWDEMLNVLEKHPYLRVNMPHMGLYKNTAQRMKRLGFLLERYPNAYTDMSWGYYTYQQDGFEVLAMNRTRSRDFIKAHENKIMFASDMVLEPSKDMPYIMNTLRSYQQFLEMAKWRFFIVPSKLMHGMALDDDTLHHIYESTPASFLLLDDKGNLPDRTKGWPIPGVAVPPRPPIPPLTADMIPPLIVPRHSVQPGEPEVPAEKQGSTELEPPDPED